MKDFTTYQKALAQYQQYYNNAIIQARTDFRVFCELISKSIDKDIDFNQPTYKMVIDVLQAVSEKKLYVKIDNEFHLCYDIFLNACPGWGKSFLTTLLFNVWMFSKTAFNQHYVVSNSQQTRRKFGMQIQQILDTEIYNKIFDLQINNAICSKRNSIQSSIDIMSSRSAITGSRGHFFAFDDFLNPAHIKNQWHITTKDFLDMYLTRVFKNPKKQAIRLYTEQRIDFEDVTGYLMPRYKKGKIPYVHIKIPYKFTSDTEYIFYIKNDCNEIEERKYNFQANTFSSKFFNEYKWNTTILYQECKESIAFRETQYQQNPIRNENILLKEEWFNYYEYQDLRDVDKIFLTTDIALEEKKHNDYSVIMCWGKSNKNNKIYLLDMIRFKKRYMDLKEKYVAFFNKWNDYVYAHDVRPWRIAKSYIEDTSVSKPFIEDLKYLLRFPIEAIKRTNSKVARVELAITKIAMGCVYLPQNASFSKEVIAECVNFSEDMTHSHDDIVDCLCDAVIEELMGNRYQYEPSALLKRGDVRYLR